MMKRFYLISLLIICCNAISSEGKLHCSGRVNLINYMDDETIKFEGLLVWDLGSENGSYTSILGLVHHKKNQYTVNRLYKIDKVQVSSNPSTFEFIYNEQIILDTDNLPVEYDRKFPFMGKRIYRIQPTLKDSYLISNAYGPLFICHDIHKH